MKRKAEKPDVEMHPLPFKIIRLDRQLMIEFFYTGLQELEKKIGYFFKNKLLLIESLTHHSYKTNCLTDCYNSLEWLGDRVLGFIMSHFIHYHCKDTVDTKSATFSTLTSNDFWAVLTVKHGFHKHLKLSDKKLKKKIAEFAKSQIENGHQHMHEHFELLEADDLSGPFATYIEPPKELADIWEALAGAIYQDSGNSVDVVWAAIAPLLDPHGTLTEWPKNPVQRIQRRYGKALQFEETQLQGSTCVTLAIDGEQISRGIAKNAKTAKSAAAKHALRILAEK